MTAYEMRISDWSSDVCSSDLRDDSPTHIGSTDLADSAFATFFPAARNASFSQGCKPDSLYDDEAFGTPNGLSLPFLQAGIRYSGVGVHVGIAPQDQVEEGTLTQYRHIDRKRVG